MRRISEVGRAHPVVVGALALLTMFGGIAVWVYWTQVRVEHVEVSFAVPTAAQLTATDPSQTVYRIDASRSGITYEVDEHVAGVDQVAKGSTQGVAGDIVIDSADPSASQVGEIVVNVQQLTSDQALRDQRLQHDFLESAVHPLAYFRTTAVDGLPAGVVEGTAYPLTLAGDLTVKDITAPTTLDATATLAGDELSIQATTEVLLSTFEAGPIRLLGFVSTGDEVRLTFDLVAVDAASQEVPTLIEAPARDVVTVGGPAPAFSQAVQSVLEQSCASCHEAEGVGSSVWKLETAEDAAEIAGGLELVVGSGYMPPWHATDVGIPLRHDLRLSQEQIDDVVAWARGGGQLDVEPTTPIVATERPLPTIRDDVEVVMSEPYDGSEEVSNDYRCFVLDPKLTETSWFQAYDFRPDQIQIVHHATAFRGTKDDVAELAAKDAADPGPGWSCTTTTGAGPQFLAWTPGQDPTRFPEGTAMRFDAGDVVVVQMHYHLSHTAVADQSKLVLERADGDESTLDEVKFSVYLGPAEIPCSTQESGPLCDRAAVQQEIARDYGPASAFIGDAMMMMCGTTLEDYAGMTSGVASSTCDRRVVSPGELLAVFGHMHERGATYRLTLNPDTPDEKVLLDIANWDFAWQRNYIPAEEIVLVRGDVLRFECSWDRDRKPQVEPRYITWAEGTEDEMCYTTVTTADRR